MKKGNTETSLEMKAAYLNSWHTSSHTGKNRDFGPHSIPNDANHSDKGGKFLTKLQV
jgi:hypothetical protein